ncbi:MULTISPECIES: DUF3592 domain-containing protein [unclassified Streptomyces]|uniref:DUF3592 domain-containing protein n=1 Tax=unclassified Streptomyces TaxID=2593676 RepID=UPI0013CA90DF|nr:MULTISPECIES: DUF3592 domain-containing protein [unclassified Streptomyces]NDZ71385.1 DUF3592 domain-containing protein [Streptomyces sp. SID10362]QUW93088.1 hypothetical protein KE639_04336 [Streptomyces sp. V17-9]WKX19308.1 DUF3592 domain-containing protein [Streptomyces sp. HUAS CX7]
MSSDSLLFMPSVLGLLAIIWISRRRLLVRNRGVEVEARCYDREWRTQGGGPTFLLSFPIADGNRMTCSANESDVPAGTRVGDFVAVLYDPQAPGRVETVLSARKPLWKRMDLIMLTAVEIGLLAMALG